jgi:pimeloyl-ACP methyl ester carboxylesterase
VGESGDRPSESKLRVDIDWVGEHIFGTEAERRDNQPFKNGEWSGRLQGVVLQNTNYLGGMIKINNTDFALYAKLIELKTSEHFLKGRVYSVVPVQTGIVWQPPSCSVLVLSGSGGSSEHYTQKIAKKYFETGLVREVIAINYRGFGGSIPVNAQPEEGTCTTTEKTRSRLPLPSGLYNDARAMFDYAVSRLSPSGNHLDLIIHGYSLGGAVAGGLIQQIEQGKYQVKGLVLDRPMESLIKAGQATLESKFFGKIGGMIAENALDDDMDIVPKLRGLRKDLPILVIIANDQFKNQNQELLHIIQTMDFIRILISDSSGNPNADHENHDVVLEAAKYQLKELLN